jgi:hypothetical protein
VTLCCVAVEGGRGRRYTLWRRGGRAVECGGLENRYVGNPGVEGSNPSLSAVRCAVGSPPASFTFLAVRFAKVLSGAPWLSEVTNLEGRMVVNRGEPA